MFFTVEKKNKSHRGTLRLIETSSLPRLGEYEWQLIQCLLSVSRGVSGLTAQQLEILAR